MPTPYEHPNCTPCSHSNDLSKGLRDHPRVEVFGVLRGDRAVVLHAVGERHGVVEAVAEHLAAVDHQALVALRRHLVD